MNESLKPYWDEERQGVVVPLINKCIDAHNLAKSADWEHAMKMAAEQGKTLMSKQDAYAILFFLDDINAILKEHGGDPLDTWVWTSQEYCSAYAWYVSFGVGYVDLSSEYDGFVVRAVVAL